MCHFVTVKNFETSNPIRRKNSFQCPPSSPNEDHVLKQRPLSTTVLWEHLKYSQDPHVSPDSSDDSPLVQLREIGVTPWAKGLTRETTSGRELDGSHWMVPELKHQHQCLYSLAFRPHLDLVFIPRWQLFPRVWLVSVACHCWGPGLTSCLPLQLHLRCSFFFPNWREAWFVWLDFGMFDLGPKSQLNG